MTRRIMAIALSAALTTTGCASAAGPRVAADPAAPPIDRSTMAEYAQRIPAGSRVRVEQTDGRSLRGTLMKAGPDSITVQRNTRVPEPPVQIPIERIARLTLDQASSSVGKNIAIGVASGVGATFGVLLLLAAIWGD
ncbi:MAG TPA: hypothetical protein VFK57_04640 [Vicinamibacterales bacterium]|nr:hypothetical protein [Vicinamibacterales bacterium]